MRQKQMCYSGFMDIINHCNKPFLTFYKMILDRYNGKMTREGLCYYFGTPSSANSRIREIFNLVEPDEDDLSMTWSEANQTYYFGLEINSPIYWGVMDGESSRGQFNEFRQNIVLLCAALNGELD